MTIHFALSVPFSGLFGLATSFDLGSADCCRLWHRSSPQSLHTEIFMTDAKEAL
jgi:hypothetical protein